MLRHLSIYCFRTLSYIVAFCVSRVVFGGGGGEGVSPNLHFKNTVLYSVEFLWTSRQASILCDSLKGLTSFLSSKTL